MTHAFQNFPATYGSRRKRKIAAAYEFICQANLSPEMRRALLGNKTDKNRKSSRPAFLRLFFAMQSQRFPISPASMAMRAMQDKKRADDARARLEERKAASAARKHLYVKP